MKTLIISLLLLLTACREGDEGAGIRNADSVNISIDKPVSPEADNHIEINCDSIFREKGYKIFLADIGSAPSDEDARRFAFKFLRHLNGREIEIFNDTIESSAQKIQYADYNGDATKDILIQNYSDARSNWTYHLFLVDEKLGKLKKVRGFEEIKNPTYLASHDIVTNYVNSGTNWTSFYKIQADTVIDLDISIEDDLGDDGSYQRKYDQVLVDIKRRMKNNR